MIIINFINDCLKQLPVSIVNKCSKNVQNLLFFYMVFNIKLSIKLVCI